MPETSGAPARPNKGLIINRGVTIVGSLSLQGEVLIEGAVDGEVRCTNVQIAERGVVDGLIVADKVLVLGEFVGAIYAKEIRLGAACAVEGHIFHRKLVLEEGCYFEGKSRCYANPLVHAPAPEPPPWSGEELTANFQNPIG
jgi:cytoskeletal protein CcmA (bactofilin family)